MSRRVKVIKVPQTVQVPPGNITPAEWTAASAAIEKFPAVKERVVDLADYVDITGTSNSTAGMLQAIADAEQSGSPTTLYLRSGSVVKIDAGEIVFPVDARNLVAILGDGVFGSMIQVEGTGPALQMDPSATPVSGTRRQYWRLENLQVIGPGRGVSGSAGLHLNNALQGALFNVQVNSFETGVHVDGHDLANGAAAYYNDFYKLAVSACGTALLVSGQANSNRFHGGSFRLSDIGVHLTAVNNVVFVGSDIEGNSQYGAIIDAYQNHLLGVRLENRDAAYDIEFRDSSAGGLRGRKNTIAAYWQTTNPSGAVSYTNGVKAGENIIMYDGFHEMGDANSAAQPYAFHLTRSASANGKPMMLLEDTYAAAGSPDGYVYRMARSGSRAFVAQNLAGDDRFAVGSTSSGSPYVEMTSSSGAKTTIRQYHLNPEGVVAGNIGDVVVSTSSSVGGLYVKESGNGTNTGWRKV